MIEVQMSKDIREAQPKIIGPFSMRQVAVITISLCYGIPLFFILGIFMPMAVRAVVTIILMAPTLVCGWCNLYGMPLEKFAVHIWKNIIMKSSIRKYKNENLYQKFEPQPQAEQDNKNK